MKSTLQLLALGVVTCLLGCTQARRLSVLEMPDSTITREQAVDIAPYLSLAGVYDGVYLTHELTIEHSGIKEEMFKNWEYAEIFRRKYIVLNPEARWLTTYEIGFKPDKLYMRITSPLGQVRTYGLTDLQEVKAGKRTSGYKFAFPNVEKGSVIDIGAEFSYGVKYFLPPMEQDVPLQFSIPCEHVSFRFSCPEWWTIEIKDNGTGVRLPVITEQDSINKKTTMSYAADNIPAWAIERFSPPPSEFAAHLAFRVTNVTMMGQDLEIPLSWDKAVERLFKYGLSQIDVDQVFTQRRRQSEKTAELVVHTADSVARSATTLIDTLQAVSDYMGLAIKRSDESNYGNALQTLDKKEGDVLDICATTLAMLEKLNLRAHLVLVHDADDGFFDRSFVSFKQLQVCAVRATRGNNSYLLFPYYKHLPVGIIPPALQGQFALVLGDKSINSIWETPRDSTESNRIQHSVTAMVDTLGVMHATSHVAIAGSDAYGCRRALEKIQREHLEDTVKSWVLPNAFDGKIELVRIINDTDYYKPLEFAIQYSIPNAVTMTPEEEVVRIEDLLAPIIDYRLSVDSSERKNDIAIDINQQYNRRLALRMPKGWVLTTKPPEQRVENQFGTLVRTVFADADSVVIEQLLTLRHARAPKEKIGELEALVGKRSVAELTALVFEKRLP
jgi:hypothetical protein